MQSNRSWWCPDERFPRGFHRASRFFAHRSTTHARGRFVSETRAMKADLSTPKIDRGLDDIYVKETSICFIDGQRGRLVYRGYDIRELAEYSTFEETVFLLLQGHLPNSAELEKAKADLAASRTLPPSVLKLLRTMPEHAPPMDVLRTAVSYMSGFDPERDDSTRAANLRKALRLTAQLATVVATYERIRKGQRVLRPDPRLGHAEDFLRMITGTRPDTARARMMGVAPVRYADHGMNASTFGTTVAASTLADLYSTVVGAIATLKGPLHGGAIEAALNMIETIGKPDAAENFSAARSEEHTSELQSPVHLVCRLLLEKKKKTIKYI